MAECILRCKFSKQLLHNNMRIAMESAAEAGIALSGDAMMTQLFNSAVGQGIGEDVSTAYNEPVTCQSPQQTNAITIYCYFASFPIESNYSASTKPVLLSSINYSDEAGI